MSGAIQVVSTNPSDLVPIPPKLTKRLYGPIILQHTLNGTYDAMPGVVSTSSPEPSTDNDSRDVFPCFVNKLAQICDCKHGGDTVTAVAILQPATVEYHLTSNKRTAREYENVKRYLTEDVLNVLQSIPEDGLDNADIIQQTSEKILVRVLAFNRRRIRAYVKLLCENIGFCITGCTNDNTAEAAKVAAILSVLEFEANETNQEWSNGIMCFSDKAYELLAEINNHYDSFQSFLRRKSGDDRGDGSSRSVSAWALTRHAIGRLHSYWIGMRVLIEARKRWPDLFDQFEVIPLPSAERRPNPIQMKERQCTAIDILKRLTQQPEVIAAYTNSARQFNDVLDIDAKIKEQVKSRDFYTIVHAEVNLSDSIARSHFVRPAAPDPSSNSDSGDDKPETLDESGPARFYNEAAFGRYIGCSKPTCLLCDMYLASHPLDIKRRKSHGNLYPKWRAPDVYVADGREASERRRLVLEDMVRKLRASVTTSILEKTGRWRRFDSRHTPSDPWFSAQCAGSVRDLDAMSTIGELGERGIQETLWDDSSDERTGLVSAAPRDDEVRELDQGMERLVLRNESQPASTSTNGRNDPEDFDDDDDDDDDDHGGAQL